MRPSAGVTYAGQAHLGSTVPGSVAHSWKLDTVRNMAPSQELLFELGVA
jgi:hypothetical protein